MPRETERAPLKEGALSFCSRRDPNKYRLGSRPQLIQDVFVQRLNGVT